MKKISVILPYYNDKEFLADSIRSVLNQSFGDFELILINHASTDGSEKIAKSFKDERIKHINLEINQGAGGGLILDAFLRVATGKYFKSMCADDILKPNCLNFLSHYLDEDPSCAAVFGNMEFIDKFGQETGEEWYSHKNFDVDSSALEQYFRGNSVLPYPGAMVRMVNLRKIKIDIVISAMFDMSLWVQFLVKDWETKCLDNVVCQYRIHEGQESSSAKSKKLARLVSYESPFFYQYFLDLSLKDIKKLLPSDIFARIADESDKDFVIAHHFSYNGDFGLRFFAINYIHRILEDEQRRKRIKNKFGYEILDLRNNYSNFSPYFDLSTIKTSKLIKELRRRFKSLFKRSKKLTVA